MSSVKSVKDVQDSNCRKLKKVTLDERSDSGITLSLSDQEQPVHESDIDLEAHDSGTSCNTSPSHVKLKPPSNSKPISSPRTQRKTLMHDKVFTTDLEGETKLNQYLLKEDLGRGSYGMVKLVYNQDDNNLYAMKIMSKKKLIRQGGFARRPPRGGKKPVTPLDRVYQEIALLKKLDHPNVVKLIEVLDDPADDSLYMVFELMKRGELLEVPTNKPLQEDLVRRYFRDVVLGLEYLHFQKIIHRDLKPSNLLLDDNGNVKIADLGVSQQFSGADAEISSTVGTPAFLPPEAVSGKEGVFYGRPLDIWSLGITLFSLIFGDTPFKSPHILELHEKICNDSLVFPSTISISSTCKDLISKMLKKNPTDRVALQQIKRHSWLTEKGTNSLISEADNCKLVTVTEEDVKKSVKIIPRLNTLILVKSMLKKHSFKNPLSSTKTGSSSKT